MDMSYTPEQVAFRKEVREWIQSSMPAEIKHKADNFQDFDQAEIMQWHKVLAKKGWVAPNWPEAQGGTGWDVTRRSIFARLPRSKAITSPHR